MEQTEFPLASFEFEIKENHPPNPTTGIIFHKDMLKHSMSWSDETIMMKHEENPRRLTSILNHLNRVDNLLVDVLVETEFEPATLETVTLCHP